MEDYNDRQIHYYDRGAHNYDGGWRGSWLPDEGERAGFEAELGAREHDLGAACEPGPRRGVLKTELASPELPRLRPWA